MLYDKYYYSRLQLNFVHQGLPWYMSNGYVNFRVLTFILIGVLSLIIVY
jgi:hypothetical protein